LSQALARNVGTCRLDEKGDIQAGGPCEDKSTDARHRGGATRSSREGAVNGAGAKGLRCSALDWSQPRSGGAPWIGQSRSTFRNGRCGKLTKGSEPTMERLAWTANRLRTSRLTYRTTSIGSGIGCRLAVTFSGDGGYRDERGDQTVFHCRDAALVAAKRQPRPCIFEHCQMSFAMKTEVQAPASVFVLLLYS